MMWHFWKNLAFIETHGLLVYQMKLMKGTPTIAISRFSQFSVMRNKVIVPTVNKERLKYVVPIVKNYCIPRGS